jgi:hypothetical protein
MKVQLQHQSVRIRVDEGELAKLLAGEALGNLTRFGLAPPWALLIQLGQRDTAEIAYKGTTPLVVLPAALISAYRDRLPCRDGLSFQLAQGHETLHLQFDVDIRDSMRQRGAPRRRPQEATLT